MYFPFLRGKQFELKAIREFYADNPAEESIIPIIEPVNSSNRALVAALTELRGINRTYAIILNPKEGDFKHSTNIFSLPKDNPDLFSTESPWIPGFLCDDTNEQSVLDILDSNLYTGSMLVFLLGIDLDKEIVRKLISHKNVEYIVVCFRTTPSPRIKKLLKETSKKVVYMEDCFKTKKRNADYAIIPDEPFSSVFSFYSDEGYFGYSDFTALSSEVNDGGMLPYALAIHLTYQKSEDEINIHHFVSDTNYDQTNIKGKFQEAAMKIAPFFVGQYHITPSIDELIKRADDPDGFPNLGYLKKLSVKNHLELISSIKA